MTLSCTQTFSGRGGEFFKGEPRQEFAFEREASWGMGDSKIEGGLGPCN
jgi:hypothetical protein